jgi:hypothetical protein
MRMGRGRRRGAAVVPMLVALAGCTHGGGTAPVAHSQRHAVTRTPECRSAPYQPRVRSGDLERPQLAPPARHDVRNGVFVRRLALDHDSLVVHPPRQADRPAYDGDAAVCAVLASTFPEGVPVGRQSPDTAAVGLARVSVKDSLLHGHSMFGGNVTSNGTVDGLRVVNPTTPAPTAYHDRLGWVIVVTHLSVSSCPAYGGGALPTSNSEPGHHGYSVFVVDAATGGDALLYTERANGGCPGSRAQGPFLDVPLTSVSVPWQLMSMQADRLRAEISFEVGRCDGYSPVVLVERRHHTATVPVVVQRPFGPPCGPLRRITEKLRVGEIGTPLPHRIIHAPIGPFV